MSPLSINKKCDAPNNVDRATKVFEKHGDFIRAVIRFNVKNEALSEDLFQDLFLFLIMKPIPEEVQNIRGFLHRVVSRKIKDSFRRIGCYQTKVYRYSDRRRRIIEDCPDKPVIDTEEAEKMFESIRRYLPPNQALAVTLRYRNDYDTMEVAETMGIKPRSVSSYVSVGIRKLRRILDIN